MAGFDQTALPHIYHPSFQPLPNWAVPSYLTRSCFFHIVPGVLLLSPHVGMLNLGIGNNADATTLSQVSKLYIMHCGTVR